MLQKLRAQPSQNFNIAQKNVVELFMPKVLLRKITAVGHVYYVSLLLAYYLNTTRYQTHHKKSRNSDNHSRSFPRDSNQAGRFGPGRMAA